MGKVYDVTVTFERKISPKDYESAGAKVELRALIGESESEEEVLDRVSALAVSKTYSMLGVKAPNAPAARPAPAPVATTASVPQDDTPVAEETPATTTKPKRGRPSGTTAAEIAARAEAEAAAASTARTPDPTDTGDEDDTPETGADFGDEAPVEVTDADLNAAMQKKNAELQDPARLRAIVAGYNPDTTKSFTLREIPQAKRAEFLAKVAALTKA